jgi:hypothetical protein
VTHSYSEMVGLPWVDLEIAIDKCSISEWFEPTDTVFESTISLTGSLNINEGDSGRENPIKFPHNNIRVILLVREEPTMKDKTSKFPIGFMKVSNEEVYFRVFVREQLFSIVSSNLSASEHGRINLNISVPHLNDYEKNEYYPVFSYGINISRKALCKSE